MTKILLVEDNEMNRDKGDSPADIEGRGPA